MNKEIIIEEPRLAKFLFVQSASGWLWLPIRVYVGWQWLSAGLGKVAADAWTGSQAGAALAGFVQGALAKTGGAHPDVQGWYAWFLEHAVLPNASTWSHAIAYGEVAVGIALILGAFTGIAAFFGLFMNLNFLFAGTVSTNPLLLILSIGVILAWKVAGYIGIDRWLLHRIGVPWSSEVISKQTPI